MDIRINQNSWIAMHKYLNILLILGLAFSMLSISGCKGRKDSNGFEVRHTGALRSIMSGNLRATADLDSLRSKPNLYALGVLENLKGELQIFDGKSYNTSVKDSSVVMDSSFDQKAALLVYAQVPKWEIIEIPSGLDTKKALEDFIQQTASEKGISPEKPFPFLLEGKVSSLSWHVVDWTEGDMEHTHQKHKTSGLNGALKEGKVTIIGFFSLHHKAVFTHHTTHVHMHFKTDDGSLAGHVDDVKLGKGIVLKLPYNED
ncbi:acetolactate decarboxylase [Flagellimonas sp. 2504JD4-2]